MAITSETAREIVIDDFRPGIYSDYHAAGYGTGTGQASDTNVGYLPIAGDQKPVNGQATIQNTYRCCADPYSGALIPLPKLVLGRSQALLPNGNVNITASYYPDPAGVNGYPTIRTEAYLIDAVLRGPTDGPPYVETTVLYSFAWASQADSVYHQYIQGIVWDSPAGTDYQWAWARYASTVSWNFIIPSGSLDILQTFDSAGTYPTWQDAIAIVVAAWNMSGVSGAITASGELAAITYDTDMYSGANYTYSNIYGSLLCIPRPTGTRNAALNDSFEHDSTNIFRGMQFVLAHQGRVVVCLFNNRITGTWPTSQVPLRKDSIGYLPVLDFMSNFGGTTWSQRVPTGLIVGEETPGKIELLASVSADTLLLIKNRKGGYVVRGDLDNPTIQRLPYLESTGGVVARPIACPLGLIYGSVNGIFLYDGSDIAKKLSTQIDGFFWNHALPYEPYAGYRGRFGYLHPWVAVPNNYFYDTRVNSWWRIDMPSATTGPLPFNVYDTHPLTGKLRCFPYKLTPTRNEAYYDLDPAELASSYSWQSHTLYESRDRYINIQELVLTVSGNGTVIVTLTGYNENGSATLPVVTVFPGSGNTSPAQYRRQLDTAFSSMNIRVRIEADSAFAPNPAPKVHRLAIHTVDRERIPVKKPTSLWTWDVSVWEGLDTWDV